MAKRKSETIKEEMLVSKKRIDDEVERLKQLEELTKAAQEEEVNLVNETRAVIDNLCQEKGLVCELQFTPKDVLTLAEMFMTNKEMKVITINYGLYFKEKSNDT